MKCFAVERRTGADSSVVRDGRRRIAALRRLADCLIHSASKTAERRTRDSFNSRHGERRLDRLIAGPLPARRGFDPRNQAGRRMVAARDARGAQDNTPRNRLGRHEELWPDQAASLSEDLGPLRDRAGLPSQQVFALAPGANSGSARTAGSLAIARARSSLGCRSGVWSPIGLSA